MHRALPCLALSVFVTLALTACPGKSTKPDQGEAGGAPVPSFAEVCGKTLMDCRGPGAVRLLKADGSRFELVWTVTQPVVQDDTWVTIFPGETLYLEAELSGDEVVKLRSVPAIVAPEKTITLKFQQSEGATDMTLSVSNPFARDLKFSLGMDVLDRDGLFKTSSCPAVAKGGAFEHWGYPIFQLVVTDFRLLAKDAPMVCE